MVLPVKHAGILVADLFENLEQARMGVAHIGLEGRWLRVNRAFCELTGYPEEELRTMVFAEITPFEDLGDNLQTFRQLCTGELASYHSEKRLLCKDEQLVWVGITVLPLHDMDAGPDSFIAFFENITPRKQGDNHILSLMNRYAHLFNQMPDGEKIFQALLHDITEQTRWNRHQLASEGPLELAQDSPDEGLWDWHIPSGRLNISEQWHRLLGYPSGMFRSIGDWHPLCHPEDFPELERRLQAHFSGETPHYEYEHRLRHNNGDWIWVLGKARVVERDELGAPLRIVGNNVNISERKQIEDALRREIHKNQQLFRTASDGLHVMDTKGNLLEASDSFCRMLGYTQEEMRGMNVHDWDASLPVNLDFEEVVSDLGESGIVLETLQRRKDGSIITTEISSAAVEIHGMRYIYASARDITPRKEAERLLREREATLRAILDNMPHMAWLKDRDGRYLAVNRQLAKTAGFSSPEEMQGKTDREVWPAELAARYRADDIEVACTKRQKFMEEPALDQGREYWSETFKTPIIDDRGYVLGTTGYARDITERKRAEESMRLSAAIYRNSSEAILVTDEHNCIVDANPAFTIITGYELGEVHGQNPRLLQSGRHDQEFYEQMWHSILNHGHWQGEIWDRRKNGELYPKWISISVIRHPDGSVYRHVAQFSDITEKKKKEDLIWHQANYDMLTSLPNRRLFRDRLEQELKKCHRTGTPLALLFIDLDRFKEINDTLGHDVGDVLLVEAARRIVNCVRETDTVARLGGDEFTVILPEFGEPANIERIAQHIIRELTAPFTPKGETCYISASIGITLYPNDADCLDDLMKHADQAMYVAKEEGRNRFSYYTESMQQRAMEKLTLTNELRHALEREELEVYYQPIVSLADGRICKAEALLRWKHPQFGAISPAVFIPLAEESGSIHKIGTWVFHESMSCIQRLQAQLGIDIQISVNKSPVQFTDNTSGNLWLDELGRRGLDHSSLAIEITEGLLLKDSPGVKARLDEMYERGVQISLDDFGTGFSSLSYLKKFPVDFLKIDRSFISNLNEDSSDLALTEAIIVMAHKLGIKTIAEGVETEQQRDLLLKFGCDYAQGYWFAPPMPEAAFTELLRSAK